MAVLFFIAVLLSGCAYLGGRQAPKDPVQPAGEPQAGTAPPEQKLNVAVYYLKSTTNDSYLVREVHQVPYTREVAKAALEELIKGTPVTQGAARVLPPATRIRGITIRDGFATVDFSGEVLQANVGAAGEALGIQSIVNTLTEFPNIRKVSFMVDGKINERTKDWWGHVGLYTQPFSRDVSKVYEPVIWVTSPVPGQKLTTPAEIKGSARVFEGAVSVRLVDDSGKVLAEGFTTASGGAPGRGDFALKLPFAASPPGKGKIVVFWSSPKDGSELDKVEVPVVW
ncbi:MAG: GerMN domain-containing protein [Firmicutes bacterium]|nr:GerMN domain-containing protein [Bacillota bacterium]